MAKFIGIPGEFLEERSIKGRLNGIIALFGVTCISMFVLGYLTALRSPWIILVAVVVVVVAGKAIDRLSEKQLRRIKADEAGASGERDIIPALKHLPDTYTVVCDLAFADSYGNIDHLVIGPTGVFAVDVKNWVGTVSSDGKGELLHNGNAIYKPHVRYFTRRVMDLKERLKALTKLDPYIQCLFVFPHTRIDANWGTTGAVHCIHAEQIVSYITKGRGGNPTPGAEIPRLVSAAEALKKLVDRSSDEPRSQT